MYLFSCSCSSFSNSAKQFSILSRSFPFIFLSLQLVQFSIIFVVSSSSFDNSVVLTLKSFLLINLFNVFCSLFINTLFNVLWLIVMGRKISVTQRNKNKFQFVLKKRFFYMYFC